MLQNIQEFIKKNMFNIKNKYEIYQNIFKI